MAAPLTLVDYRSQLKNLPKTGLGYVVTATLSPMLIPETSHLQGPNVTVDAWSGALVGGHITGNKVYCEVDLNVLGNGDVTVQWGGNDVGSIIISSVAFPFVTSATASPMTILRTTHNQGYNIAVDCWSGPIVNGAITGTKVYPEITFDGNGNVLIEWSGSDVLSIIISGATNPTPYVATAGAPPVVIPAQIHQQGPNVSVECFDDTLIAGHIRGKRVLANPSLSVSGNGNVTIDFVPPDVGCYIISASGPATSAGPAGPAGPQGIPGPPGGASSYVANVSGTTVTITQATHLQGKDAIVICFDGGVVGGTCTGNIVNAGVSKNSTGDFIIAWGEAGLVQSVQIKM